MSLTSWAWIGENSDVEEVTEKPRAEDPTAAEQVWALGLGRKEGVFQKIS